MASPPTALIIGAGRIGRALGHILQTGAAAMAVRWWDAKPGQVPNQPSLDDALRNIAVVILAIPAQSLAAVAATLSRQPTSLTIVTISKGVPTATDLSPVEYLARCVPHHPIVVIGGPMMAEELSASNPGSAVIAGTDQAAVERSAAMLNHPFVRTTMNHHPVAVSRAGVLKNVYGFIGGLFDGISSVDPAQARQSVIAEYRVAAAALDIPADIVDGSAGIGDLTTTLSSPNSRNRRAGEHVSRFGHDGQGAEALHSLPIVAARLAHNKHTPLLRAADRILRRELEPAALLKLQRQ